MSKRKLSVKGALSSAKKWTSRFWDKYDYEDEYSASSSYWLRGSVFDRKKSQFDDEPEEKRDYFALAQYKSAITNFVHILTGRPDIRVSYTETGDSYTDGQTVTLSATLKEKDWDSNVGLALHEASHILYSDFDLLKSELNAIQRDSLSGNKRVIMARLNRHDHPTQQTYKTLLNIVEDLYIDAMTYASAPGYRSYYKSLYHKYFGDSKIEQGFYSKEFSEPTLNNYLFHICNFRNPNRNLDALPGLRDIWDALNLVDVRRLTKPIDRVELAWKVIDIVSQNVLANVGGVVSGDSGNGDTDDDTTTNDSDALPTNGSDDTDDKQQDQQPLAQNTLDKINKLFEKQIELINGTAKKTKLTSKEHNNVQAVASANISQHQTAKDYYNDEDSSYRRTNYRGVKTLVVRNVSEEFINSSLSYGFGISNWRNGIDIERYINLGKLLAKKLQIRNEERVLTTSRLKYGKIDQRILHEIGSDNYDIFKKININQHKPSYIHICIDTSGSMSSEINECLKFATMFAVASKYIKNIHVVISTRSTSYGSGMFGQKNTDGMPFLMYVFDSKRDGISKIRNLFPKLRTCGTTPEGLTFEAIMNEVKKDAANTDAFFINLCDGQPYFSNNEISYGGDPAVRHSKKQADRMKNYGINFLTYYIGSVGGFNDLKRTYPTDSYHLNSADEVTKIVKVLNSNLLKTANT
jgi:hypothetical protein